MHYFVATNIYAYFKSRKNFFCNIHVQNEGRGVKGRLNNVKKTALFTNEGFPNLIAKTLVIKYEIHSSKDYIPRNPESWPYANVEVM